MSEHMIPASRINALLESLRRELRDMRSPGPWEPTSYYERCDAKADRLEDDIRAIEGLLIEPAKEGATP